MKEKCILNFMKENIVLYRHTVIIMDLENFSINVFSSEATL